jgi:hypothetical protein
MKFQKFNKTTKLRNSTNKKKMFDELKRKLAKRAFKTLFKDFLKELNENQLEINSSGFVCCDIQIDVQVRIFLKLISRE